ncbi:hypothetical protein NA57DRAFT_44447 [Rhizodiscina lignyota]|uniref:Splicing factor Cactin n=1 Tax=Rhizodiscina lignyota TaxID=1504668 RepID=A0A9P4I5J5_9PEZI|nr:hypothetical protein NA57DRAFT_44447 [Rhizodiscina lignyota]
MSHREPPPWRRDNARQASRQTKSTIPSKRRADDEEEAWIAGEDRFVLTQAKKKAAIRVKGGRAKPIDWLAVTLRAIEPSKDIDPDEDEADLDIVDPEGVLEDLDETQLVELEKDIDSYLALETSRSNKDFWEATTMKVICKDRIQKSKSSGPAGRGIHSVSADIDKLLSPKSLEELEKLEKQIRAKLASNEPIDTDYWEHLLRSLLVWKARARLRKVSQTIVNSRLEELRKQQEAEADAVREKLEAALKDSVALSGFGTAAHDPSLDPQPLIKQRPEDKSLEAQDEGAFLDGIIKERQRIRKLGYVPLQQRTSEGSRATGSSAITSRFSASKNDDFSKATTDLYEREVARGVNENEEIFTNEEEVSTSQPQWASKYRPRKPRYFNRVQMGYEWNKYNQTHYDHDNPPPKVVQGYKFNIFYPDLIDKSKAPTYRIEREGGRKRGQSFAPAGEDDTCLIKFIAGPPYEDIAFRIVDKEWDYSAKRERGFKSSFDKVRLRTEHPINFVFAASRCHCGCGKSSSRPSLARGRCPKSIHLSWPREGVQSVGPLLTRFCG